MRRMRMSATPDLRSLLQPTRSHETEWRVRLARMPTRDRGSAEAGPGSDQILAEWAPSPISLSDKLRRSVEPRGEPGP